MNINNCPECNSNNIQIYKFGFNAQVKCNNCGYTIGGFSNRETLIKIWNKENK